MFRRTAVQSALAIALIASLGACATHAPAPQAVAATLAQTPSLDTFNALVTQAGLTDTLKGTGPYTVFAPSDAAFKAVPEKTMAELRSNPAMLKDVLSYHIVPGNITATEVRPGKIKTLQGASLDLSRAGAFITVEDAMVEKADIQATNGTVHIVDRVLMPPRKK